MKQSKAWLKKVLSPIVVELQKHTAHRINKETGLSISNIESIKSGRNINPRLKTLAILVAYFESLEVSRWKNDNQ